MRIPPVKVVFPGQDLDNILSDIKETLLSGMLTLHKRCQKLEEDFSKYTGSTYAITVNSGTSSIEIPLRFLNVTQKEVIVPSNTFFATAAAVTHAGGIPRLADISPRTLSLSLEEVKKAHNENTAGVIMVHIGGIISDEIEEIRDYCQANQLFLFEDAAHAHGSKFKGKHAGTFGQGGSFSFYPTKVITSGEGGIIITDDEKMYNEALIYRDQGKAGFLTNFHTRMGYNWRMSEIHAAIGNYQLQRLDQFIEERRRAAVRYDQQLSSLKNVQLQPIPADVFCNYYKYIAFLAPGIERDGVKKEIKEKFQVSLSGEVYDTPLHQQPVFEPYSQGSFPNSEDICSRMICLPIFATMSDAEVDHVVAALAEVVG